jgi:hypothetical protein
LDDYCSFIKILKYQDTSKMTQLENYTTELFVFIINYLKYKKSKLFVKIMNIFDLNVKTDFNNLYITTQKSIDFENKNLIPDIFIEYNGKKIIIEVKVDSKLNNYSYKNKEINQIEYYEKIKGIDKVFLLSKRILNVKRPENRILWSNIHEILNINNDFIIKNFITHLEENGMSSNKITKENINSISNAISSLEILDSLLKESWPDDEYNNYSVTPMQIIKKEGRIQCYVNNDKDERLFWIALYQGDTYLYISLENQKIKDKLDEKQYSIVQGCFSRLNIDNILKFKTNEKQKIVINNWYKKIMKKLMKLLQAKNQRLTGR